MLNDPPLPVLAQLMLGYARADQRALHQRCWALDARLAAIFRSVREPAIAAIRLAWWRDVLVRDDRAKGGGDPLVEAWRAAGISARQADQIDQLIDGWGALVGQSMLDATALRRFADGRGAGLFGLLAGDDAPGTDVDLSHIGAVWALWDLAGHVQRADEAGLCIAVAADQPNPAAMTKGRRLKPLRLLAKLAQHDVRHGHVPHGGFALRHYARLLILAPFS